MRIGISVLCNCGVEKVEFTGDLRIRAPSDSDTGIKKIPVLLTKANKRFLSIRYFASIGMKMSVSFIIEGSHQGVKNLIVAMSHNKGKHVCPQSHRSELA